MKTVIFSLIAGLIVTFTGSVAWADHNTAEALESRIAETGTLNIMTKEEAAKQAALAAEAAAQSAGPVNGENVYNNNGCSACHAAGLLEAPIFGNADAWADRIAKGQETLISSAINGLGNMPAQGPTLSDEQIAAAVEYIVENSQ